MRKYEPTVRRAIELEFNTSDNYVRKCLNGKSNSAKAQAIRKAYETKLKKYYQNNKNL